MRIKNSLFLTILIFLISLQQSSAQFKYAMIGVNGLTCSACTKSVEMSIRKLHFVKDVEMNLEHTEGKVIFADNVPVDISGVAKAITDAGFSVRYLTADFVFQNITVNSGFCYKNDNSNFQFVNTPEKKLNGESQLKFLNKEFLPKTEFNKTKSLLVNSCADKTAKVYFVTL